MGKRVNYCARSVVTCDAHLSAAEIMVPRSVIHRLTRPVVVNPYNIALMQDELRHGRLFSRRPLVDFSGI